MKISSRSSLGVPSFRNSRWSTGAQDNDRQGVLASDKVDYVKCLGIRGVSGGFHSILGVELPAVGVRLATASSYRGNASAWRAVRGGRESAGSGQRVDGREDRCRLGSLAGAAGLEGPAHDPTSVDQHRSRVRDVGLARATVPDSERVEQHPVLCEKSAEQKHRHFQGDRVF